MKVLSVVDGSGWTGGVEQALLLSRELRRKQVDARLAAHVNNPVLLEAAGEGIPAFAYEGGGGRISPLWRLHTLLAEGYDFAIGHKPVAIRHLVLPLLLGRRRSRLIGVRRVSYPVSRLTIYRFPERVVAVSQSVRSTLAACGLRDENITVIPSGVDTERFRPLPGVRETMRRKLGIEGRCVVLNLAKYVPEQKGQHLLFAAASSLKERYPLTVLLAGIDTDGAEARRAVAAHGLEGIVHLLGFRRDIPELLNAADLFVFPSLPGLDAIAGSVLQAMSCGGVAVASAVGGIPEYLRDGENGFLVPPSDGSKLCDVMERAFALSPEGRLRLGQRARETVCRHYSAEAMAAAYLEVLERLQPTSWKGA